MATAKPTPTPETSEPAKKKRTKSPPNRFILAARYEAALKQNGQVIANASKRLAEAANKRRTIIEGIPLDIRALLRIGEDGKEAPTPAGSEP